MTNYDIVGLSRSPSWVGVSSVRVRLNVRPGDYGDVEFESFTGMIAVLDGMVTSLHNTDWLSVPLDEADLQTAEESIAQLKAIFGKHREDSESYAGHPWDEEHVTEVTLSYRPQVTRRPRS